MNQDKVFSHFARTMSRALGHPLAFGIAVLFIVVWLISGPFLHFSDSWQLVANTVTTLITFLMVFLIQNTQNRDSEAMQVKLDELIHALKQADNRLLDTEELTEEDLQKLQEHYTHLAEMTRSRLPQQEKEEKSNRSEETAGKRK